MKKTFYIVGYTLLVSGRFLIEPYALAILCISTTMLIYSIFVLNAIDENVKTKERKVVNVGLILCFASNYFIVPYFYPIAVLGIIISIHGISIRYKRVKSIKGLFEYDWFAIG
ncbi:MAG: hypothetical protein IPN29_11565 [Saprospiraceae bacterium]|nr:hypothetical protein [Saprospiraceae bacterium]